MKALFLFFLIPALFAIYAIASTLNSLSTGIARAGLQ